MSTPRDELARGALLSFERSFIPAADALADRVLLGGPDAVMLNLKGRIALAVGRPDVARRCFERAIELDPYMKPARKNLAPIANAGWSPGPGGRYLLIKPWRQGFWSDVDHTLGALLLAEITGRTPVVHWNVDSLFCPPGAPPEFNAFEEFFEPVGVPIGAIRTPRVEIYPPGYTPENLHTLVFTMARPVDERPAAIRVFARPEPIVAINCFVSVASMVSWLTDGHPLAGVSPAQAYRSLARTYLRPRPSIVEEVDRLATGFPAGKTLAVHLRGTDKASEDPRIPAQNRRAIELAHERMADPAARLFLLTDSDELDQMVRAIFPGRVLGFDATRGGPGLGLHFRKLPDPVRLGREVLRDVLAATRADAFIGHGWSNVSCAVRFMREWPVGACTLLGEITQDVPPLAPVRPDMIWRLVDGNIVGTEPR